MVIIIDSIFIPVGYKSGSNLNSHMIVTRKKILTLMNVLTLTCLLEAGYQSGLGCSFSYLSRLALCTCPSGVVF